MPIASAIKAIPTCQLRESPPSQEAKMMERSVEIATAALEKVRIDEKVLNFALSMALTLATFNSIYAKMRA